MRTRRSILAGGGEAGYAVLLAIFLVASLLLFAAVAAPNVLTEGRRLREQEAIWRGNQYVRAIRLYYQKNGKYPSSLEDLTKPNAAGVHFLRKAYKEPMNKADGSWRLIYVTGTGQLVGSVHYHTLQEMAVAAAFAGQLPGGAAGFASQLFGGINQNQAAGAQAGASGQPGAAPRPARRYPAEPGSRRAAGGYRRQWPELAQRFTRLVIQLHAAPAARCRGFARLWRLGHRRGQQGQAVFDRRLSGRQDVLRVGVYLEPADECQWWRARPATCHSGAECSVTAGRGAEWQRRAARRQWIDQCPGWTVRRQSHWTSKHKSVHARGRASDSAQPPTAELSNFRKA